MIGLCRLHIAIQTVPVPEETILPLSIMITHRSMHRMWAVSLQHTVGGTNLQSTTEERMIYPYSNVVCCWSLVLSRSDVYLPTIYWSVDKLLATKRWCVYTGLYMLFHDDAQTQH